MDSALDAPTSKSLLLEPGDAANAGASLLERDAGTRHGRAAAAGDSLHSNTDSLHNGWDSVQKARNSAHKTAATSTHPDQAYAASEAGPTP